MLQIDELTLSPKPPSSGMVTDYEKLDDIAGRLSATEFTGNVSIKVVVFKEADYEFAREIHKRYPEIPFFLQVGNDDTVTTDDAGLIARLLEKYKALIDRVTADQELNDVKVLPQLHTLLWGNKRGV
jgi:7-carboxy-7-deazaguanine synthase